AWQSFDAARTVLSVGRSGISSAALSVGFLGIVERNRDVAPQALCLRPPHGTAAKPFTQLIVGSSGERGEIDLVPGPARLPRGIVGSRRARVPRTDFLAAVAPIDVRADRLPLLAGQIAAQLDREVGNAPRRVEYARRDDRVGRARLQAQRARAA